ncbi:hypothetical protein GCM10025779_24070 [Arthrobacter cryoconiti]
MTNTPTRRSFLGLSVAAATMTALAACTPPSAASGQNRIKPTDPLIADVEASRAATGKTITTTLTPAPLTTTLSGKTITTAGYNGSLMAPTLRGTVGDQFNVTIANKLSDATSVHWHGLALRNNDDGVPGLTQDAFPSGSQNGYNFKLPHPGTYWYHSHVEMQREQALYGALIIEDPNEALVYDKEWVIVLDDWLDGINGTPTDVLKELSQGIGNMGGGGMKGMDHGNTSQDGAMPMGHMPWVLPATFWAVTPGTSLTPSISSMARTREIRKRSQPNRARKSGCASSTRPVTPPTGSVSRASS